MQAKIILSRPARGAMAMRVRLKDIAADLNLSKMTISKVLRGQTDISEATKARVLKRVKELNYIPISVPAVCERVRPRQWD